MFVGTARWCMVQGRVHPNPRRCPQTLHLSKLQTARAHTPWCNHHAAAAVVYAGLPAGQLALAKAIIANCTGAAKPKPVVVVLVNGGQLAIDWLSKVGVKPRFAAAVPC